VRLLKILFVIAVSLVLQTTLARFLVRGSTGVDLVLVGVAYLGLTTGPVAGLLSGTIAGLAQDSLGTGVLGIGGLSKTVVGFLAGIIGTAFIVSQPIPRFLVFFGATWVEMLITGGLHVMLDPQPAPIAWAGILPRALGNALVGVVVFQLIEGVPGMLERRRSMSRARSRR